ARPAPALLCGALRALLHLGRDRAYPEGACGPDGGMRITDAWLRDEGLQQVLQLLTDAGHLALLVGGCVRNALLGQPVADIDIATDAVPDRVIKVAGAAGLKVVPTGVEHGTVTIVVDGVPHEVTTFRRDVETFGRHATVAFSTRVEE